MLIHWEAAMIIERLRREHHNVEKLLALLERELKVFDYAGHTDYEVLRSIIGYFALYPEVYHHPQEDLVFAKLKIRDPAAAAKVGDLAREHHNGTELLQRAAGAVATVLADNVVLRQNVVKALRDFMEHQRRHMMMEDRDFFPAAVKALEPQDWTEIASASTSHNDPLFSDSAEQTFDTLRTRILQLAHEAEIDRYCEAFARLGGDAHSDHWRYRF
jgi:hemerythrin-like domain-containing protein